MGRAARRILGLLAVLVALGPARSAHADAKRVVVLEFRGPGAARLHGAVTGLVNRGHDMVSPKAYWKAARRLDARRMRADDVRVVARQLKVDIVVEGKVVRRGSRSRLLLRMRDGATGEVFKTYAVPLRTQRLDSRVRRSLGRKLVRDIAYADPLPRRERPVAKAKPKAEPKPRRKAAAKTKPRPTRKAVAKAKPKPTPRAKPKATARKPSKPEPSRARKRAEPPRVTASKPRRRPAAEPERRHRTVIRYDDDGQAHDNEVPDALK